MFKAIKYAQSLYDLEYTFFVPFDAFQRVSMKHAYFVIQDIIIDVRFLPFKIIWSMMEVYSMFASYDILLIQLEYALWIVR